MTVSRPGRVVGRARNSFRQQGPRLGRSFEGRLRLDFEAVTLISTRYY